jgi:AAA domain
MTFHFKPAVRERVSLLIGIAGASGSGKTYSALSIAQGLAGPTGRVAGIDTEAKRMLHYADRFKFDHGDLPPPFGPDRYMEAIAAADAAGYDVIVIDSLSHEWEGEGGLQDMHDTLLDRQVEAARASHNGSWAFDENKTRERLSVGAWKQPKMLHKRFVSRLLQCRAHLVMCLRADEKLRIEKVKDERGRERTVITQAKDLPPEERWSPICERRFPYELGLSLVLTPQKPGFPVPIKLQEQHKAAVPLDRQLSAETGRHLAEWARGSAAPAAVKQTAAPAETSSDDPPLIREGAAAAEKGRDELQRWWDGLTQEQRRRIGRAKITEWEERATAIDLAGVEQQRELV